MKNQKNIALKLLKQINLLNKSVNREKRKSIIGKAPGTLIYTGVKDDFEITISSIKYNGEIYKKEDSVQVSSISSGNENEVLWLNVEGLHDIDIVKNVSDKFNIHSLIQEDILTTDQRPKIELIDGNLVIFVKMLYFKDNHLLTEHLSFILTDTSLITFQELKGDIFDGVRNRLESHSGRIRHRKADYLLFALLDTIVDNYFLVLEEIGDKIDELEDKAMTEPSTETLAFLQLYRKYILTIRKSVYPLREVVNKLNREEFSLINQETEKFFGDLYDHTIQIIETIETFKENINSLKDIYMSSLSNKMNEVMKVLTIIATIFIPLTFIAGVYGMNFENMPELAWENGYYISLGLMLLVSLIMVTYFKIKKWL